jgi:hypothetical protein
MNKETQAYYDLILALCPLKDMSFSIFYELHDRLNKMVEMKRSYNPNGGNFSDDGRTPNVR